MNMHLAPLNQNLIILSFAADEEREISDLESRLMHLGFFYGQTVRIIQKAPLLNEPFLIEVRGRRVALTREEASLVTVEVKL